MTDTTAITFTTALVPGGDMSSIPIDFDPRAVFGKARAPVVVTINGYAYRSTIFTMRGETFVPLRASHRSAAGFVEGGAYEVTLTLDTAPREVEMPDDLAAAIDTAGLSASWGKLSFTAKREQVEGITSAKRPETRAKRLAAALALLATT